MRFSHLGAAAALTSLGSALLLPPTIPPPSTDIIRALPLNGFTLEGGVMMEVNCPGCPVVVTDLHGKVHRVDAENRLKLNFTIVHGDSDQLLLNDKLLYPLDPSLLEPMKAAQFVRTKGDTWQQAAEPALGFALTVQNGAHSDTDDFDILNFHVEIIEVAGELLTGRIPNVDLKLLQSPSRKLILEDAKISTPKSSPSTPGDDDRECTTLACKWKAIIADRISRLKKGCGRKGRPNAQVGASRHGRPHSRPHGSHRFTQQLARFVSNTLVFIFYGFFAGILAFFAFSFVFSCCTFVRRDFRAHRQQYTSVQQDEEEAVEDFEDDSKSFAKPPPKYEAASDKTPE